MSKKKDIIKDPVYRYKRFDPIPEDEEITQFYESQYYELIKKGNRASELRKLMAGGKDAAREREWLHRSLYTDIAYLLKKYAPGKRVLDVGCGTGELVSYLNEAGLEAEGIELSKEASEIAKSQGIQVYTCFLEELSSCYDQGKNCRFDAITMLNVLEHVPGPAKLVEDANKYLREGGVLCARVPNDFNEIQAAAQKHLDIAPWWIAYPDHINYFDCGTLQSFLEQMGFEVLTLQTDFPMDFFLLMGDVYVGNPEIGKQCHEKRIRFELSISAELRRKIYQAFADIGLGRNSLAIGRLKG